MSEAHATPPLRNTTISQAHSVIASVAWQSAMLLSASRPPRRFALLARLYSRSRMRPPRPLRHARCVPAPDRSRTLLRRLLVMRRLVVSVCEAHHRVVACPFVMLSSRRPCSAARLCAALAAVAAAPHALVPSAAQHRQCLQLVDCASLHTMFATRAVTLPSTSFVRQLDHGAYLYQASRESVSGAFDGRTPRPG